MTGRRHKPRPPGIYARVICTGRGEHEDRPARIRSLTLRRHPDGWVIAWDAREGPPPVTGYRDADGWKTFELACPAPRCRRDLKRSEPWLAQVIEALAAAQNPPAGDPVIVDISVIERV